MCFIPIFLCPHPCNPHTVLPCTCWVQNRYLSTERVKKSTADIYSGFTGLTHHGNAICLMLLSPFARWGSSKSWPLEISCPKSLGRCMAEPEPCNSCLSVSTAVHAHSIVLRLAEAAVVAGLRGALWFRVLPAENIQAGLAWPLALGPCRGSLLSGLSLPHACARARGQVGLSRLASSALGAPCPPPLLVLTAGHGVRSASSSTVRGTES